LHLYNRRHITYIHTFCTVNVYFQFKYGYFRLLKKTASPPTPPPPTPSHRTVHWGPGELFSELLTIPPLYSNIFWFDTIHGRMIFLPSSQKQKGTPCLTSWSLGPVCHKTATWREAPQRRRPKDWGRSGQVSSQKGTLWHLVSKAEATRSLSDRSLASAVI
jgi:hypothetical protein